MNTLKLNKENANDVTYLAFLDIFSDFDQIDYSAFDGVESIVSIFQAPYQLSNDYWSKNVEKTKASKVFRQQEYSAGNLSTVAHHVMWNSLFNFQKEGFLKIKGEFSFFPLENTGEDENVEVYHFTQYFTGVKNVKFKKRFFSSQSLKEISPSIDSDVKSLAKFMFKKKQLNAHEIFENENGILYSFLLDSKKDIKIFGELSFEYEKSEAVIEDSMNSVGFASYDLKFEVFRKKMNKKFKKRAKRK